MPASLDATGLTIKTVAEMVAEVQQDLRDTIDQELDVEEESELGQIIGSFLAQLGEAYELIQEGFNAQSPSSGSGFGLDQVAEVTGSYRSPATRSYDFLDLDLDAGAYPAGTLIVHVQSQPAARFANAAEVTSVGAVVAGVRMEAEETGPVRAPAGTLTVIAEAVTGFNAVADDPDDAVLGALEESDTSLRVKRVQELYRRGSTSPSAIAADLIQVEDVVYANVLENDTLTTNGDGLPGKSIEAVVLGGADQDIRDALLASKAAGIQAYGSVSGTATDSEGNVHTIAFSRPTDEPAEMVATVTYFVENYPTPAAAEAAIKDALKYGLSSPPVPGFDTWQVVGRDIDPRRYTAILYRLPGIASAVVEARTGVNPFAETVITIGPRALASLDLAFITVAATPVGAYP